jgi:ribosomal-protein-alanine N-acetyltransferase
MKEKIVKMKQRDLKILFVLGKKYWKNKENWLTSEYINSSFNQKGASYVAKINNKVVGGIILVYEDIVKNWIRYLIVDSNYQKMEIGRKLLQKALEHVGPGESVFLDVSADNKTAIRLYKRNGFKNKGRVKDLYRNNSAYIFSKKIT